MKLSPVVIFAYKRLLHITQTIEALKKNELSDKSTVFIFSDGPKNIDDEEKVEQVRKYLKTINGFKEIYVIEREKNYGLSNNIVDGVTRIVNEYGKVIVMEDDLLTSPYFLKFMNQGLEIYEGEEKVVSIHGYIYPIEGLPETFFIRGADCWGWATWREKWKIFEPDGKKLLEEIRKRNIAKEINFNNSYNYVGLLEDTISGKVDSWAVKWYISAFLKGLLTLYPGVSYVNHIGSGIDATHASGSDFLLHAKLNDKCSIKKIKVKEDKRARKKIEEFFRKAYKNQKEQTFSQKLKLKLISLMRNILK